MEDAFDVQKLDLMEDEQLKDGFKFAIKKQDRQITKLEQKSEHYENLYQKCMEEHARAETRLEFMEREHKNTVGFLRASIEELRGRLEGYQREYKRENRERRDPRPSPPPFIPPVEGETKNDHG